jgi:hypothetical protein
MHAARFPSFVEFMDHIKSGVRGLEYFSTSALEAFNRIFRANVMPEDVKKLAGDIFKDAVLSPLQKIFGKKYEDLKQGKGSAFNIAAKFSSEAILERMLAFREKLDQVGLGKFLDLALTAAIASILGCITFYCPPLAIVVAASGILDKMKDFVKADSLKSYLDAIKTEKRNADHFENIGSAADNFRKLFEHGFLLPKEREKILESYLDLSEVNKPNAREIIKQYTEIAKSLPQNAKQLDKSSDELKNIILESFKSNKSVTNKLDKLIAEEFTGPLRKSLFVEHNIFSKIAMIHDASKRFAKGANDDSITDKLTSSLLQHYLGKDFAKDLESLNKFKDQNKQNKGFVESLGYFGAPAMKFSNNIKRATTVRTNANNIKKDKIISAKHALATSPKNKWASGIKKHGERRNIPRKHQP